MPKIERAERRVAIDPTPIPYDRGRGGQAIGEGISAFGSALSKLGREQSAEAEAQEQFDVKMKADEYTYQRSREVDDEIANYNETQHGPPGEFDARYAAKREAQDKEFVDGIQGSPKAKRLAMAMVQNSRQSAIGRAQNARQRFVQETNIGRVMAMVDNAGDAMDGNPETVATAHAKIAQDVAIVPGLTPAQRNRAMDMASKKLWDKWFGKANEEQMERGLAEYHQKRAEWAKKFEQEEKPRAGGGGIENHGEHSTVSSGSGARFRVATPYADRFAGLIADIEAEGVTIKGDQSGGYAKRNIAGTNTPSRHSYGEAIDINWSENGRGARGAMARQLGPEKINEIAKRHGMTWGGNWRNPDDMHFEIDRKAVVQARAPAARTPSVGGGPSAPLSTSPEAEAPDGTTPAPPKKFALPDKATPYDHMVNNFGDIAPKVQIALEKFREHREKVARFNGIMAGDPWNFNDPKARKEFDEIAPPGIGDAIAMGTPMSKDPTKPDPTTLGLALAARIADKANHVPPNIYAGLKTLTDSQDVDKKVRGYNAILSFYDKNPNIFDTHGDNATMLKEAERFRFLRRTMDGKDAVARMMEEKSQDFKTRKQATADDVERIIKPYKTGTNIHAEIAKDMDGQGDWSRTFRGVFGGRPKTDAERKQFAEMIADYRASLEDELIRNGGNLDDAKAGAISRFKHRYGVSNLFGKERVMAFPPERHYSPNRGEPDKPYAYIEREIKEHIGIYNTAADPDSITLRPLPRRDWGPDGRPAYAIEIRRKDNGKFEEVPLRYVPGNPDARQKFMEEDAKVKAAPKAPAGPTPTERQTEALRTGQPMITPTPPQEPPKVDDEPSVGGDTGGYLGASRATRSLSRKGGPSVGIK